MEIEARFYYSLDSEERIINKLKSIDGLFYDDKYFEETLQYNHPMKEFNFYDKKIDGRFRVRKSINSNSSKCMITWKRRFNSNESIHQEEEIELDIKSEEYNNLLFLLNNVLHLELVESYERYRNRFYNDEVEIVVDHYPFGIAIEVENKSEDKDGLSIVEKWIKIIGLDINNSYKLSWDDKYEELCREQNKNIEKSVTFDKDMPKVLDEYK